MVYIKYVDKLGGKKQFIQFENEKEMESWLKDHPVIIIGKGTSK